MKTTVENPNKNGAKWALNMYLEIIENIMFLSICKKTLSKLINILNNIETFLKLLFF